LRRDHANTSEFYHQTFIDCEYVANTLEEVYEYLLRCDSTSYISAQMPFVFCQRLGENVDIDVGQLIENVYNDFFNLSVNAANAALQQILHISRK